MDEPTAKKAKGRRRRSGQNSLKHGLLSGHLLPTESKKVFKKLLDELIEEFNPTGPSEEIVVQHLASLAWRLMRAQKLECALYSQGTEEINGILTKIQAKNDAKMTGIDPQIAVMGHALESDKLFLLLRYENELSRLLFRNLAALKKRQNEDS